MGKRFIWSLFIAITVVLSACGEDSKDKSSNSTVAANEVVTIKNNEKSKIEMADKDVLSIPASLNKNLPINTMAYLRIPSVKNTLSHKGTIYDPALGNKVMTEQLQAIYQPLVEKFVGVAQGANKSLIELLLANAVTPLEVAILKPSDPRMPFPIAVFKLGLQNESFESIQTKIQTLATEFPVVINKQPTKNEIGEISVGPIGLFVDFDINSGELILVGGHVAVLNQAKYKEVVTSITSNNQHPMLELEKEIDTSGKGLFSWFDLNKILNTYKNVMPPAKLAKLEAAGIDKMESIAIGSGVVGGKAKFSIIAKMPELGFKQYMYKPNNSYGFTTAGVPRYVASLSLPTTEQIAKTEALIKQNLPQEQFQNWMMVKGMFAVHTGINFDDIFTALDSELVSFGDDAGDFLAIKVKDKSAFKTMLDNLVKKFQLTYEVRDHKGQKYHHLIIPNVDKLRQKQLESMGSMDPMLTSYLNALKLLEAKTHLYWIESGDYLIAANIPQLLMDRVSNKKMVKASDWLSNTQKIDASRSLMLLSTTVDDLPKTLYKFQLGLLNYLNDITNAPVEFGIATNNTTGGASTVVADKTGFDIFKLPTPAELNLPEQGTYSIQFDISDSQMALNITSDFSAIDAVFNQGGLTAVAITGVLAAVAIPAYQDYTIKAKVQEAYSEIRLYTYSIDEHYMTFDKFPSVKEISQLDLKPKSELGYSYSIAPNTGIITGIIDPKGLGYDMITLRLIPKISEDKITWSCHSSGGDEKYIPAECY